MLMYCPCVQSFSQNMPPHSTQTGNGECTLTMAFKEGNHCFNRGECLPCFINLIINYMCLNLIVQCSQNAVCTDICGITTKEGRAVLHRHVLFIHQGLFKTTSMHYESRGKKPMQLGVDFCDIYNSLKRV